MIVTIFNFHGNTESFKSITGFNHNQQTNVNEEELSNIMFYIFKRGLNVMLLHGENDNVTLMVDDKKFRQR